MEGKDKGMGDNLSIRSFWRTRNIWVMRTCSDIVARVPSMASMSDCSTEIPTSGGKWLSMSESIPKRSFSTRWPSLVPSNASLEIPPPLSLITLLKPGRRAGDAALRRPPATNPGAPLPRGATDPSAGTVVASVQNMADIVPIHLHAPSDDAPPLEGMPIVGSISLAQRGGVHCFLHAR